MVKVVVNKTLVEIDNIMAFGCSYTAGAELLDHLIHPDADNIKRKKGMIFWKENFDTERGIKNQSEEGKISWAAQVANRLQVKNFTNKALGGSSLGYSLFMLEDAITKGEITDTTLVLVGITSMHRVPLFEDDNNRIKNMLLSSPQYWPKHRSWDASTVLTIFNTPYIAWTQLNYLHRFVELSKQHNFRIQLFKMPHNIVDRKDMESIKDTMFYDTLMSKVDEILREPCIHNQYSLLDIKGGKNLEDWHGGGHPKIHIHEKFADWVVECLGN